MRVFLVSRSALPQEDRKKAGLNPGWEDGFEAKALGRRRNLHLPRLQDPDTSYPSTESRI